MEVERIELSCSDNVLRMTTCLSPPSLKAGFAGRRPTWNRLTSYSLGSITEEVKVIDPHQGDDARFQNSWSGPGLTST